MNIWFKLSPDQTTDFQVPWSIASAPESSFYSTMPLKNLYHSGPWLLLSLQSFVERPSIVTFQPCTVKLSYINEFDSFNPLHTVQGGQLNLNGAEISGLVELLVNYADQMPNGHVRPQYTFEEIKPDQWDNFHLYEDPATSARQRVFLQVHDLAADLRQEPLVSLIVIKTAPFNEASSQRLGCTNSVTYSVAFRQFSIAHLSDPQFSPLNQAVSRIDLDKYGLVELAMLLQKIMGDKPHFPLSDKEIRPFASPNAFPLNNSRASRLV
ncbi:MAG: hypothetical protein DWQ04_22920 [Chloroflexi bacterium]|nr:MAG: hypothetical protein DWQ04_22920 [Chloroflexota bacterium]